MKGFREQAALKAMEVFLARAFLEAPRVAARVAKLAVECADHLVAELGYVPQALVQEESRLRAEAVADRANGMIESAAVKRSQAAGVRKAIEILRRKEGA